MQSKIDKRSDGNKIISYYQCMIESLPRGKNGVAGKGLAEQVNPWLLNALLSALTAIGAYMATQLGDMKNSLSSMERDIGKLSIDTRVFRTEFDEFESAQNLDSERARLMRIRIREALDEVRAKSGLPPVRID